MLALDHLWILAAALLLDAAIGDPDAIWRRVPHPVVLVGKFVDGLDRALNRRSFSPRLQRGLGAVALVLVVAVSAATGVALHALFGAIPFGWIGTIVVAAVLLAGRSLYDHVAAVADGFATGGLTGARAAVAHIVGRDPSSLDEAGVSRAAIESLAENFSDGVVAPAFWFAILGLPGLLAYKAINTADSMIGHLSDRHRHFGWAAAKVDDLINLAASRLAGFLIALAAPLAGGAVGRAMAVMTAEAGKHRSPNAGWPEAAMAAAVDVTLAGPRRYRGVLVDDDFINAAGRRQAPADDIRRALLVYRGAWVGLFALAAFGGVVALLFR